MHEECDFAIGADKSFLTEQKQTWITFHCKSKDYGVLRDIASSSEKEDISLKNVLTLPSVMECHPGLHVGTVHFL